MHKFIVPLDDQRGRPLSQGVPSFKTVRRTVLKFTPCGAPEGKRVSPSADGDQGLRPLDTRHL